MKYRPYFATSFVILILAIMCSIPSAGQVIKGSISGTVTDPQGAVVPGAQVVARNIETGAVFNTTSDGSGLFRLSLIPVGTYELRISATGFKTAENKTISVGAGTDTGVGSVALPLGEATTTVDVTTGVPLIETTQAQVTNTFSGTLLQTFSGIEENQGLDNLALFVPGVTNTRSDNFSNRNGVGFSVDGLRGRNNDQQIDGQNNNDNSVGGPGLFLSNPEFVDQYVITTNQFSPEYGRNSGSVVNILTKSGTNAWHGSIFGTESSNYLNALSNADKRFGTNANGNPLTGPPRTNEEFSGFTLGGPIVKNKAFLFGGFDSDLFSGQTIYTSGTSTPTPAGLATLAGCFPGSQNLTTLSKFGPFGISAGNPRAINPTLVNVGSCTGVEISPVQRILSTPDHEFDFVGKQDLQLGSDTITTRYLFNRNNFFNQASSGINSAAAGYVNNVPAISQDFVIGWTHNLSSHMVNELRGSFGRLNVEFGGSGIGTVPDTGQLDQAVTNVTFQNTSLLGFGPSTQIPQGRIVNTWQVQDNWNYVVGKHSLKAGVNWTYQRSPNVFLPNINGQFRFGPSVGSNSISNNLLSFVNNTPNRVSIADGTSVLDFREYDTFLYFGDDWKITQNLTLNLGLTWSYYGQPANLFTDITVPRESNPATALFGTTDRFGNPIPLSARTFPQINTPTNSFAPSLGFAYSPQWGGFLTGNGKTVIRGGYRLLYDPPFYNIYTNISSAAPVSFLDTFAGANAANKPLPATPTGPNVHMSLASTIQTGVFDPRQFAETTIPQDFSPDRVQSWSFGVEREITKNAAFEARYVGNHGDQLFQSVNQNPFIGALAADFPNLVPAGLTPCPASQAVVATAVGRVNCNQGVIRSRDNTGFSDYNALQVEFRATNLFNQLTLRSGYTWSKTTDNVSEIFSTQTAGNTIAFAQNPLDIKNGEHSISGLDFPQRWTLAFTEQLPFFKKQQGFMGHLLGGWSISGDYILGSGQGFTPAQVAEATLTGGDFFDNLFNGTFIGVETARPFLGNPSAPMSSVGIFCGDAQSLFGANCATVGNNQLISLNALNVSGNVVPVTNKDVRFIENTGIAEKLFGTPFGNVARNSVRDAISNIANLSVYKNIRFNERASFELHATALNVLNHYNFTSVDPFLEDAGNLGNGNGFGNPSLTDATGRSLIIGGVLRF